MFGANYRVAVYECDEQPFPVEMDAGAGSHHNLQLDTVVVVSFSGASKGCPVIDSAAMQRGGVRCRMRIIRARRKMSLRCFAPRLVESLPELRFGIVPGAAGTAGEKA